MPSWRVIQKSFWDEVSLPAYLTFTAAVAVTFSSIGFLTDLDSLKQPFSNALYGSVLGGLTAALFFYSMTRGFRWIPVAVLCQISMVLFLRGPARREPWVAFVGLPIEQRLRYDMLGATLCVILGYTGFVIFIGREGRRWASVQAEMRRFGVEMPIAQEVCAVLFEGKPCRQAVSDLMERVAKEET